MEVLDPFLQGLGAAFSPINLLMLLIGITVGMIIGVIPGVSAANGIALLLPVTQTFGLAPETALILFAAVYYGAKYGGRIAAILADAPGDIGSSTTRLEGYPLAKAGQAGRALSLTAFSSFVGGTVAIIALTIAGGAFVSLSNSFGPPEYVALIAFVFVLIFTLSSANLQKSLISLCLGLMLAVVGLDWGTGVFRYTSTIPELFDGIDFIIVVLGVFSLSEAFLMMETYGSGQKPLVITDRKVPILAEFWRVKWSGLRASVIGVLIGILPGAGTYVANLAAYRLEKKLAGKEGTFGRGDSRGLIAPEAAKSATAFASFIPLLALGIPGSATTAVLHGALLQMNIDPGQTLCRNHPEIIWAMIGSMYLGNLLLFVANIKMLRLFPQLLAIPGWIFMPIIVVISFVSVYAMSQSIISLLILVLIGIFAYCLRKFNYPLAPLILGYVLGKPFEDNLRLALAIGGDVSVLLQSRVSIFLWIGVVVTVIVRIIIQYRIDIKEAPSFE